MKFCSYSPIVLSAILVAICGCGDPGSEHAHNITPPTPRTVGSIPSTKEQKIAAINHAPMSEQQKKAEISKVNAGL
jgi:hypothetical protein